MFIKPVSVFVCCVYIATKTASVATSQVCLVFASHPFAEGGVQASRQLHGLQRHILREPLKQVDAQHQDLDWVWVRQVGGLERAQDAKCAQ